MEKHNYLAFGRIPVKYVRFWGGEKHNYLVFERILSKYVRSCGGKKQLRKDLAFERTQSKYFRPCVKKKKQSRKDLAFERIPFVYGHDLGAEKTYLNLHSRELYRDMFDLGVGKTIKKGPCIRENPIQIWSILRQRKHI